MKRSAMPPVLLLWPAVLLCLARKQVWMVGALAIAVAIGGRGRPFRGSGGRGGGLRRRDLRHRPDGAAVRALASWGGAGRAARHGALDRIDPVARSSRGHHGDAAGGTCRTSARDLERFRKARLRSSAAGPRLRRELQSGREPASGRGTTAARQRQDRRLPPPRHHAPVLGGTRAPRPGDRRRGLLFPSRHARAETRRAARIETRTLRHRDRHRPCRPQRLAALVARQHRRCLAVVRFHRPPIRRRETGLIRWGSVPALPSGPRSGNPSRATSRPCGSRHRSRPCAA